MTPALDTLDGEMVEDINIPRALARLSFQSNQRRAIFLSAS
jgi:hypothetical protein